MVLETQPVDFGESVYEGKSVGHCLLYGRKVLLRQFAPSMCTMAFSGKPVGLANLGNTCYLNSLLQCLNSVGFLGLLTGGVVTKNGESCHRSMYAALKDVLNQMASRDTKKVLIIPQEFVQTLRGNAMELGRPDFAGWQQNDVAELYTIIGECVHEATRKTATVSVSIQNSSQVTPIDKQSLDVLSAYLENQYSLAAKALTGVESSVITDSGGQYISCRSEVFYTMAVPVPPTAASVQDCVNAHGATVKLTGDNKYAMPDDSATPGMLVDANQNHVVWLAPQFLVVETRLYRFDNRTGQVFKGSEKLAASPVLELETWSSNKRTKVKFLLCGVAYHRGGNSQGGHYTAVVRNKEGQLWNCNDTLTAPLARGQGWPAGGYCFFYRKIL